MVGKTLYLSSIQNYFSRYQTDGNAYEEFKIAPPTKCEGLNEVVTDSKAQSCLWSREDYLDLGLKMNHLIPVSHSMTAATSAYIEIDGESSSSARGPKL